MTRTVLGIGECMVELSPDSPGLWRQGYAGDVLNTLWYMRACLGEEWHVAFHTALGDDRMSDDMRAFFEQNGIDASAAPVIAGKSPGLYAIHLDQGERSFSYWRGQSAARDMLCDPDSLRVQIATARLVYLSGITLAILTDADAALLLDLLTERPAGCQLAFDPNIRPKLWRDADHMRDTIRRAAVMSDIFLHGTEDEALAFGSTPAEDIAKAYRVKGIPHVVVKDGAKGVYISGPHEGWIAPDVQITPVDTTAAGDSFVAGYLSALLIGAPATDAARLAHRIAAKVITFKGALCPQADISKVFLSE